MFLIMTPGKFFLSSRFKTRLTPVDTKNYLITSDSIEGNEPGRNNLSLSLSLRKITDPP